MRWNVTLDGMSTICNDQIGVIIELIISDIDFFFLLGGAIPYLFEGYFDFYNELI